MLNANILEQWKFVGYDVDKLKGFGVGPSGWLYGMYIGLRKFSNEELCTKWIEF